MTKFKQLHEIEEKIEHKQNEYETVAIIKPINVFDAEKGKYTTEVRWDILRVETFVKDLKTEKPEVIGYINVKTLNAFLDGNKKAVPITIKKEKGT